MMLGIIKRNFRNMTLDAHVTLYKALVRSHLEYAEAVWAPYRKEDIENVERVQMRATKMFFGNKNMSYEQRLKKLDLPTLRFRRLRGDMIEVYKLSHGIYDACVKLRYAPKSVTRGNSLRLESHHVRYNLRKFSFGNRVTSIWNSLPEDVVSAPTVNSFKNRLDKHWLHQCMRFDWRSELEGTGNRS